MRNIIYIFCDELRQDALGCYGNAAGAMRTPHIDSIAANGTLFENCYCNSPVCVPSRTSILTGLYPEDTAVYHNEAMLPSFELPRLPVTFPEVLRDAGYRTASFGKTHLPLAFSPFELDDGTGGEMSLGLSQEARKSLPRVTPGGIDSMNIASLYPAEQEYYPEQVTRHALAWMARQEGPYFVRISYLQPHTPVIVKRGYEALYADRPFSGKAPDLSGLSQFERAFADALKMEALSEEEIIRAQVYYYGMVAWLDGEVGKILDFLRESGGEEPIVIFGADHGAVRGECGAIAGKHIFNRASHAVPLLISGPGVPKGNRVAAACSNIDLPRTLFGLLGLPLPEQFKGTDLFSGQPPEAVYAAIGYGEAHSYAFPNLRTGRYTGGRGWPRRACIRTDRYRLDRNVRLDGRPCTDAEEDLFFVDCRACPAEDRNMADRAEYAPEIDRLSEMLRAHCAGALEVPGESVRIPDHFDPSDKKLYERRKGAQKQ